MRILFTADLHYDIARSIAPTEHLAMQVKQTDADALVILGDACGHDVSILRRCLDLFDRFPGKKFYVAGNHDLWSRTGCSLDRYERELATVCQDAGVWYLDAEPYIHNGLALVGSIGWYDYSFRQEELGIPLRFYEHKVSPGAAARLPEHRHLVEGHNDLTEDLLEICARWMDGVHVRLTMSDREFTDRLCDKMTEHLQRAASQSQQIIVAMHHLPVGGLVRRSSNRTWAFANAYMGSDRFGQLIADCPKVTHVLCGHSHWAESVEHSGIRWINAGCTYREKHCVEIDTCRADAGCVTP